MQTPVKMLRNSSNIAWVNTLRRNFVTKTKCTCIRNTQCLPWRVSLLSRIGQSIICTMQRLQAFKYELQPNGEQRRAMGCFAGSRRFVYNKALALQNTHYEAGGKFLGYVAMANHLTAWPNCVETPCLKYAPVHHLKHTPNDLVRT